MVEPGQAGSAEDAGRPDAAPPPGQPAPPRTWQDPPHPAAWRWLRWVLPPLGAGLLAAGLASWSWMGSHLRDADGDSPPFWFAAFLMVAAAGGLVASFRLPWRRYLPRTLGLEALGAVVLVAGWLVFLTAGGFGMCGLTPGEASWTDPALFAAVPAPGALPGHAIAWDEPPAGLPFNRTADPSWGPHNLTTLGWRVDSLAGGAFLALDSRGWATLEVPGPHAPAAVRAAFLEWSRHATAADEATRASWADAFVASNRTRSEEVWRSADGPVSELHTAYRLQVPGPFRLGGLHAALEAAGALAPGHGAMPGLRSQSGGAWSFDYALAQRTLAHGGEPWEPGGYRLAVDSSGTARFEGLVEGERSEQDYGADVAALLASLGLPPPDPAAMHVGGSIC